MINDQPNEIMINDQPNDTDGRGTVNCNESGAVVDRLISVLHGTQKRVSELEETMSDQQAMIDDQQEAIEEQQATIEEQQATIDTQQATIEEQDARIDGVEEELASYRADNEHDKAEIRSTLTDADEQSTVNLNVIDTLNTKVKEITGELKRVTGGRSSLEQIVRLPDAIATESLTKNQLRSRAIAAEITSVRSKMALQGRKLIDSQAIREKLREKYGKAHYQTVSRVMDFLNEMGGEQVRLKQGEKRKKLVFDPELIDQLEQTEQLEADEIDALHTNGVMATVREG